MSVVMSDAVSRDLGELARRRRRVVVPLLLGSLGAYAVVLLAFAYWPALVRRPVVGAFNVAYLLAVSQFLMTFTVGIVYSRWAARVCDPLAARIRAQLDALATEPAPATDRRAGRTEQARAMVAQEV
jgi:uncharacterized membrane protein (DUF485 family)